LICGAKDHPSPESYRIKFLQASIVQRLDAVADPRPPLQQRAVLAWYASGLEWGPEKGVPSGTRTA
jgi:hypothetical protein